MLCCGNGRQKLERAPFLAVNRISGEWQNSGLAWYLNKDPAMWCFSWKIWAKYRQQAEDPGINNVRTCSKSRPLRHCCFTSKGNRYKAFGEP